MNGANSDEKKKLVNFNRHFKARHTFNVELYKIFPRERRRVVHSTAAGLLRDLKLNLLNLYYRYSLNVLNVGLESESETDTDSESDTN